MKHGSGRDYKAGRAELTDDVVKLMQALIPDAAELRKIGEEALKALGLSHPA